MEIFHDFGRFFCYPDLFQDPLHETDPDPADQNERDPDPKHLFLDVP